MNTVNSMIQSKCDTNSVKRSVFRLLFASMLAFGFLVGIIFPPFARLVLDSERALSPVFIVLCITAGLIVGLVNFLLFRVVVSRELGRIVTAMQHVLVSVAAAENTGEGCEDCQIAVTSKDAIGEIQCSFNNMAQAIASRLKLESATRKMHAQLSTSVDLSDISKQLLAGMAEASAAHAGLLYGDVGDSYELLADFGVDRSPTLQRKLNSSSGPLNYALQTGKILPLSLAKDGLAWISMSTPIGTLQPHSMAVIPLMTKEQAVGLALVSASADQIAPPQLEILEMMRSHGAPYLQNAILHRKIQDLAAIDDLTRILNRRFGIQRLNEEFSRSVRHGIPMSVFMIDIDHFKIFNDDFGHDAGDAVLKVVAKIINESVRSGDIACRYGGEEFMMVAPGTGQADSVRLAERLRRQIETTQIAWGQQNLSVTISIGIATWPMTRVSLAEELLHKADMALYFAKNSGRNRTAVNQDDKILAAAQVELQPAPAE